MAPRPQSGHFVGAIGIVACARPPRGCVVFAAQSGVLPKSSALDAGHCSGRHGLHQSGQVCVLTKLRPDMKLTSRFEPGPKAVCHQGQRLEWMGYEARDQLHWFGVNPGPALCDICWERNTCPRHFSHAPSEHEILFGSIPLSSAVAQKLLSEVRAWAEGCQSYEKNQLGLKRMFFNSLRLTWTMGLLADAVSLLRAKALLAQPSVPILLHHLMPTQLSLELPQPQ